MKTIRISPSEIAFLWDRCPRCWYRKVHGMQKPKDALPKMFRIVDSGMKRMLTPEKVRDYYGIPVANFCSFEKIISEPFVFDQHGVQLVINGRVDKAAILEDGTCAVFEYKMTEATDEHVTSYSRQATCYAIAIENAANHVPIEVSRVDLFFLDPYEDGVKSARLASGTVVGSLTGAITHRPVDLDRAKMMNLFERMAAVAGPLEMPDSDPSCSYCATVAATIQYDARLAKLAGRGAA